MNHWRQQKYKNKQLKNTRKSRTLKVEKGLLELKNCLK